MSHFIRNAVCLSAALVLISALPAFAQKAAKQQARAQKRAADNAIFQLPKDITLSAEQQAKLKALKDEYAPKLAAMNTKQSEILTEEQRTARTEAGKANREGKKTGKQAQETLLAALKLTDEQKPKWQASQKEMQELRKTIEQKKSDLLTEEQKAKLPKRRAAK